MGNSTPPRPIQSDSVLMRHENLKTKSPGQVSVARPLEMDHDMV